MLGACNGLMHALQSVFQLGGTSACHRLPVPSFDFMRFLMLSLGNTSGTVCGLSGNQTGGHLDKEGCLQRIGNFTS